MCTYVRIFLGNICELSFYLAADRNVHRCARARTCFRSLSYFYFVQCTNDKKCMKRRHFQWIKTTFCCVISKAADFHWISKHSCLEFGAWSYHVYSCKLLVPLNQSLHSALMFTAFMYLLDWKNSFEVTQDGSTSYYDFVHRTLPPYATHNRNSSFVIRRKIHCKYRACGMRT